MINVARGNFMIMSPTRNIAIAVQCTAFLDILFCASRRVHERFDLPETISRENDQRET